MEIVCVPAIISITFFLIELYKKYIVKGKEKLQGIIPIISLVIGGILGVATFFIFPDIIVADNEWVALIVGMASGLSSVGGHQVFKQLKKYGIEVKENE